MGIVLRGGTMNFMDFLGCWNTVRGKWECWNYYVWIPRTITPAPTLSGKSGYDVILLVRLFTSSCALIGSRSETVILLERGVL